MQKMENKLEDKNRFKIILNVQEKKNPKPIQVNSQLSKLSRLLAKMFPCELSRFHEWNLQGLSTRCKLW